MEDYKLVKDIMHFVLSVAILIGILLLVFKWKEAQEKRVDLYFEEIELKKIEKENAKKESTLYDIAIEEKKKD